MTRYLEAMHTRDSRSAANKLLNFLVKTKGDGFTDAVKSNATNEFIAQKCGAKLQIVKERKGSQCEFGRYDEESCTITVYECSSKERDLFSFYHELAHHAQGLDPEWADDSVTAIPPEHAAEFRENTADHFASLMLVPEEILSDISNSDPLSAALELNDKTSASWSVIIKRVCERFRDDFALALCDTDGKVLCCDSSRNGLAPPRKGSVQKQVGQCILDCNIGETRFCRLNEGIKYSTGRRRADLDVEVRRLNERLGLVMFKDSHSPHTRHWIDGQWICPNPACGHVFSSKPEGRDCASCGQVVCPECGECECRSSTATCPNCHMVLSPGEQTCPSMHECL